MTGFTETEITLLHQHHIQRTKSIFLPISQLYQLAYQKALPHHTGLKHQKEHFLVKTPNVQNFVYTDHILDPALTLQSKQKAREHFQIRIPWHGFPLHWPTASFPQALISANLNNPDLRASLPAAAQFKAGFDRGLQQVKDSHELKHIFNGENYHSLSFTINIPAKA